MSELVQTSEYLEKLINPSSGYDGKHEGNSESRSCDHCLGLVHASLGSYRKNYGKQKATSSKVHSCKRCRRLRDPGPGNYRGNYGNHRGKFSSVHLCEHCEDFRLCHMDRPYPSLEEGCIWGSLEYFICFCRSTNVTLEELCEEQIIIRFCVLGMLDRLVWLFEHYKIDVPWFFRYDETLSFKDRKSNLFFLLVKLKRFDVLCFLFQRRIFKQRYVIQNYRFVKDIEVRLKLMEISEHSERPRKVL
jgi:hypothetical protein